MFEKEIICFDFRIIEQPDGTQIIDESVKTPMDSLMPEMQVEYMKVYQLLTTMEIIKRQEQKEAERIRKLARNPLWKLACICGLE